MWSLFFCPNVKRNIFQKNDKKINLKKILFFCFVNIKIKLIKNYLSQKHSKFSYFFM